MRAEARTASGLLGLNGLKERLEVAGAKALVVVALDDLDKERGAVLHRLHRAKGGGGGW